MAGGCWVLLLLLGVVSLQSAQGWIPGIFSDTGKPLISKKQTVKSVGIFHRFRKPPWGGGNQFLMALAKDMRSRGIKVLETQKPTDPTISVYMANAITFKTKELKEAVKKMKGKKLLLVHRLDGPYYSARFEHDPRKEKHLPYRAREDNEVFEINNNFACATIFQSQWSMDMNIMLGYKPKEPTRIIPNAVDSAIFHSHGRVEWEPEQRRVRLMSSSWSDGERKGFKTFQWLDSHLDFDRFEYTFMGRVPPKYLYRNIQVKPPTTSEELAPVLRHHDIYIAASFLEPCSNALLEALSSGMPTLYQEGSGHGELVKDGGLAYETPDEIPEKLDELVRNYHKYQARIKVMSISEVTDRYLEVYEYCLTQQ